MPPQSRPIKICGSRLFDGREIVENGCVVFNGSRIVSVGSPGSIEAPSDAESYELRGYTILPGLVDAHVHYTGFRSGDYIKESLITPFGVFVARAIRDLERTLEAGYTTVVDAGGVVALHLKRAVEEGVVRGPRIIAAGYPISQTFGHGDIHFLPPELVDPRTSRLQFPLMSLLCDGAGECRKAARYALRSGADFIKTFTTGGIASQMDRPEFPQLTREELEAIVDEARRANKLVHVHAEGSQGIINALEAGVTRIAHAIYIDDDGINLAIEKRAVIIPTLSVADLILKAGEASGLPDWALRKTEEAHEAHIANIRRAYRAGVRIAAGTDFFINMSGMETYGYNALEIKLLVEKIGMKPVEALRAATSNAAYVAGYEDRLGILAPGAVADIIAVKGNPLDEPGVLIGPDNIHLVVKEGVIVKNLTGVIR